MAISEKIIPVLASFSGIISILLALISTTLIFIDPVASLFTLLAIPFAFISLLSKQGTLWIKIFGIVFMLSNGLYFFLYYPAIFSS